MYCLLWKFAFLFGEANYQILTDLVIITSFTCQLHMSMSLLSFNVYDVFYVYDVAGEEVTDQWYAEIKDYDFKGHSTGIKTGNLYLHIVLFLQAICL